MRNDADRSSLRIIEGRASTGIAKRLRLDNLQSASLAKHHYAEVERQLTESLPTNTPEGDLNGWSRSAGIALDHHVVHLPRVLSFTVGWGTWFQNRWVGLRWRLFGLRIARASRSNDLSGGHWRL